MAKSKLENCVECKEFDEVALNYGYCKKHRVSISMALARKMRVCNDWEDPENWLTKEM
jgi:hypothetical protein